MRKAEFLSLSQIRLVLISDAKNCSISFPYFSSCTKHSSCSFFPLDFVCQSSFDVQLFSVIEFYKQGSLNSTASPFCKHLFSLCRM
jgi:hypothetical protein